MGRSKTKKFKKFKKYFLNFLVFDLPMMGKSKTKKFKKFENFSSKYSKRRLKRLSNSNVLARLSTNYLELFLCEAG